MLKAIIMAAKVEQYIAETCKMHHSFRRTFRRKVFKNGPLEFFVVFLLYTALSTLPAPHMAVMKKASSHNYGCQSLAVYCRNLQNAAQLYMHF